MKTNKHQNMIFRYIGVLLLLLFTYSVAQPYGSIKGKVTDAEDGEELPGVNIVLEGTVLGASTSLDGSFEINQVKPGHYHLEISLLGYQTTEQSVSVKANEIIELEITLSARPLDIGAVLVETERSFSAASSYAVRKFDMMTRPNRSAQDMLQMAPGLFIAQHAGGGKAEQIFLRNFDADHGTDVAVVTDGIPVNMISHGHGQGYADLHFVIPEVVDAIDVFKGPYFANFGNLATAGAISFRTKDHLSENVVRMEGGEFNTSRLTAAIQIPSGGEHQNSYFAGQYYNSDGPFESDQKFERFNIFGKFHTHVTPNSKLSISANAFSSAWDASGQIPQRLVDRGDITRFGSIDDLEGGTTSRQNIEFTYANSAQNNANLFIQGYTTRYNFKLFSNFTFFLDHPDVGDMIEQTDARSIIGLNSRYEFANTRFGKGVAKTTIGAGFRSDNIGVSLWHSPNRIRDQQLVNSDIFERNLFLWAQQDFIFSAKFRAQLGLRGDYFTFNVEDHLDAPGSIDTGLPHASGYAQQSILSPKLNLVFSPSQSLDIFLNGGSGFHSNDARNVVISQRISELYRVGQRQGLSDDEINNQLRQLNFDPAQRNVETLPRALGSEIGFRTRLGGRANIAVSAWYLHIEREYVYVGDAGTTELSDPTNRLGLDFELRLGILPWLWGDLDVNVSDGKIEGAPRGEDNIPLAPNFTSTGGLTAIHPNGFEGSFRYRTIDDRPANEDGSVVAQGYTMFDVSFGYRIGKIKFLANLENLFDTEWNEAQFDTESQLKGESQPVSEIHFTPGNPRNVRFGIGYHF